MNKYTRFAIPFGLGGVVFGAGYAVFVRQFPWGGLIVMGIGAVIAIVGRIRTGGW